MRYKAEYTPSWLLDPETYAFHPFEEVCRDILDKDDHAIFSEHLSMTQLVPVQRRPMSPIIHRGMGRGSIGIETDDGEQDDNNDEDGKDVLSDPPPPGFLNPNNLPRELLETIYAFERGAVKPLLVGLPS